MHALTLDAGDPFVLPELNELHPLPEEGPTPWRALTIACRETTENIPTRPKAILVGLETIPRTDCIC